MLNQFAEEILNASPDAILLVDARGLVSYANAASREVLGRPPEELVGLSIEQLVPEGLRQAHQERREAYQASPRIRSMGKTLDLVALVPDGRQVPVDIKLSPMGDQTLCIVRDASERRNAEEALRRLNEELQILDGQRNRFLGILAHDLRSPLCVTRGYADLLLGRRMGTLGEAQRDAVLQIRESANLMLNLVNDLLDVTAIQEGALSLRLEPTRWWRWWRRRWLGIAFWLPRRTRSSIFGWGWRRSSYCWTPTASTRCWTICFPTPSNTRRRVATFGFNYLKKRGNCC
jgi:PAS domain S-box-containing protein